MEFDPFGTSENLQTTVTLPPSVSPFNNDVVNEFDPLAPTKPVGSDALNNINFGTEHTLLVDGESFLGEEKPKPARPAPLVDKNSHSVRPRRPPPPPPTTKTSLTKKRAGSENSILDIDSKLNSTKITPNSSERSLSTFYSNSQGNMEHQSPSRSMKQTSSKFYAAPSQESATQPVVTRQPQATQMNVMSSGGSSFYNPSLAQDQESVSQKIFGQREQIMQSCMEKRQEEYTVLQPFKIFTGTWNVNGQVPPQDVSKWLSCDHDPPDIYFIGFQELDLSKEAFLFSESNREDDWIRVVSNSLPQSIREQEQFKFVKRIRLVGMMLLVFAKWKHFHHISGVVAHQVGTGILGRMGNKGGVSIRLKLHSSTLCAVNSHLAAHLEQTQRRNEDFHDICARLHYPVDGQTTSDVYQHDVVFWLGDLNYRIEGIGADEVKEMIVNGDFKILKEKDQLLDQRREGNVFKGFSEGDLKFAPTYKYNPGTDQWDSSEKCRTPAWCDRILWWESVLTLRNSSPAKAKSSVHLIEYRSHMELKISDHKPVSALFSVKVKVIDEVKYKKVFEEENRKQDRLENEYLPAMSLSIQHIDFGEVKFHQPKSVKIELTNTGMIPCKYKFICPPNKEEYCKSWLTINKPSGILLVGEQFTLELEIYVNRQTAPLLNTGEETLDDILIFHLNGGKDFFITVAGKYLPSCFGSSIEALCRLQKPIRNASMDEIKKLSKIQPNRAAEIENRAEASMLAIPKELWALVDHLYNHAKGQEDLFQQPGLHSELEEIRDCLDTRIDTSSERIQLPGSNHSAAEALLVFVEALSEPVIPFHLYEPCLSVHEIFHLCKQVLQGMTSHHRNVFKYIMAFLRELLKYADKNGLDEQLLAPIFSGLLLRPPPGKKKHPMEARLDRERATKFISHFLKFEYDE